MTNSGAGYSLSWNLDGKAFRMEVVHDCAVLGRHPDCHVVLASENVSKQHAQIRRTADGWLLQDKGSKNGTKVNGASIVVKHLVHGDEIELGPVHITFAVGGPRVVYEEEPVRTNAGTMIPRAAIDQLLSGHLASLAPAGTSARVASPERRSGQLPAPMGSLLEGGWVISLFSQAARALLSSEVTQEVLERTLDLAFDNLPAESGFLGLRDPATGELVPRVTKSKGGDPGPVRACRSITEEALNLGNSLLVSDVTSDARFAMRESVIALKVHSAMCAPIYGNGTVQGLLYVDTRTRTQPFEEHHLHILTTLALLAAVGLEQMRLRDEVAKEQKIRDRLGGYLSPGVLDRIIQSVAASGELLADERTVSVLFADLCGFTGIAERLRATEVTRLLNGVFERLTRVIFESEGTVDKFIGDGVMAIFGAPLRQDDHALRAIRVALKMQEEMAALETFDERTGHLHIRIGINSGPVVAGEIGSAKSRSYTVIGDTVNVASRLEAMVALPDQIVIGPGTYELVKDVVPCAAMAPVQLKGKSAVVRPYLVTGKLAAP